MVHPSLTLTVPGIVMCDACRTQKLNKPEKNLLVADLPNCRSNFEGKSVSTDNFTFSCIEHE